MLFRFTNSRFSENLQVQWREGAKRLGALPEAVDGRDPHAGDDVRHNVLHDLGQHILGGGGRGRLEALKKK